MSDKATVLPAPYADESTNRIYNMIFCDNIELFKSGTEAYDKYPWNILVAEHADLDELKKLTRAKLESRFKILAYNKLSERGAAVENKELLGVVVEVGLDEGLDVLAAFSDGTARYINHSGKMIFWETVDDESIVYTNDLFSKSKAIVEKIGPWDKERPAAPAQGHARISFLVSDGLYFGQGPINVLFNDPLGSEALQSATELMQFLTSKAIADKQ